MLNNTTSHGDHFLIWLDERKWLFNSAMDVGLPRLVWSHLLLAIPWNPPVNYIVSDDAAFLTHSRWNPWIRNIKVRYILYRIDRMSTAAASTVTTGYPLRKTGYRMAFAFQMARHTIYPKNPRCLEKNVYAAINLYTGTSVEIAYALNAHFATRGKRLNRR